MCKKYSILAIMLMIFVLAQGQHVESKKCNICGKPVMGCKYKGKHPQQQQGQKTPTPVPKPKEGSIYISSTPSGAVVKLDGQYMGETPLTVTKQRVGNHSLSFSMEGYQSTTQIVAVAAGKKSNCHVSLKKKASQQTTIGTTTSTNSNQKKIRMDGNDIVFTYNGMEHRYTMVYVSGGNISVDWKEPHQDVAINGFYIGQTEVVQELWQFVMGSNPSYNKGVGLPVERVSWDDCKEFVKKINDMTGKTFRLPTEIEWVYAARGGNRTKGYVFFGSNNIDDVAWYANNSGDKYLYFDENNTDFEKAVEMTQRNNNRTHLVAQKKCNEIGLYDMWGNVSEWCEDQYGSNLGRVIIGDSFSNFNVAPKILHRYPRQSDKRDRDTGLRLVLVQ